MMETEIWPNLLRECRERGVKTMMVNGRISSRSYPRYRLVRPFFRRVLADVDRFCMQSEESARRLIDLGADPARVDGHRQPQVRFAASCRRAAPHGKPRERVLRFFRMSPSRAGDRRRQHDARRGGGGAARVRARQGDAAGRAADPRAARSPSGSAKSSGWRATTGFVTVAPHPSCRSTPSRAPTSSCSTRSASWRSSIRSRPSCSSAAAWSITAATTSSSRRSSASRSCSARTCRTSRRSPTRSCANGAAVQVQSERELEEALLTLRRPIRCGARGSARRRARWSKPIAAPRTRRWRSSPSCCRRATRVRRRRRAAVPTGALIRARAQRRLYGAAAAWRRRAGTRADPVAPAPSGAPGRSASATSRVGGSGKTPVVAHLARLLLDARRAAGDPDARLRAAPIAPTA